MAKSETIKRMEELFAASEERVLMAQKVLKSEKASLGGTLGGTFPFRKQAKAQGKERVICLTARRRGKTQGFRGMLHACKPVGNGNKYIVRQSLPMSQLTKIVVIGMPGGDGREQLDLVFSSSAFSSDARWTHEVASVADRTLIVRALYLFCTRHEHQRPAISGVDPGEVESWGTGHPETADLDSEDARASSGADDEAPQRMARGGPGLVSAREAKDLQSLLDMFSLGFSDVEAFQDRLRAELTALEDANAVGILASTAGVTEIIGNIGYAEGLVEDMEESLHILDVKLRHMRKDIAAIEARNNSLELQTRNSAKLLGALDGLLASLELSNDTKRVLLQSAVQITSVPAFADAGWELQRRLAALEPSVHSPEVKLPPPPSAGKGRPGGKATFQLSAAMAGMAAVEQQRMQLMRHTRTFTDRVAAFLCQQFDDIATQTIADVRGYTGGALPDHENIRSKAEILAPLMQVVQGLQPSALPPLRVRYCAALNKLLRQELRAVTAAGRRAAAAADAAAAAAAGGRAAPDSTHVSTGPGSPIAVFRQFLAAAVPLLVGEAQAAADFMDLYATPLQLSAALPRRLVLHNPSQRSQRSQNDDDSSVKPSKVRFSEPESADGGDGGKDGDGEAAEGDEAADSAGGITEDGARPQQVLGAEGRRAIDALFEGVAAEFDLLVSNTAGKSPAQTVAMSGVVLVWQTRLQGQPCAPPVAALLQGALEALLASFDRGLAEKVSFINKYQVSNVANAHVLPTFREYTAFAAAVEEGLSAAASELPDDIEALPLVRGQEGIVPVARLVLGDGAPIAAHATEEAGESDDAVAAIFSQDNLPEGIPSAQNVRSARDIAAAGNSVLIKNLFTTLERLCMTDAKHADRLRLENYAHFEESTQSTVRRAYVVAYFRNAAVEAKEAAMLVYIQQQLDYAKLWKLLEFSQRVDQLLEEVGPGEVPFQLHYQASDLRTLIAACLTLPDKKVVVMRDRVRKHLAHNPQLCGEVWRTLEQVVVERYTRLGEQIAGCYEGITLKPTPGEFQQLFRGLQPP